MATNYLVRAVVKCGLALALTLSVPLGASAQISYDDAVRAYYAAVQIQNEGLLHNPDRAEAARQALIIARNHGFYPGFEPTELDLSLDPDQGGGEPQCGWVQNEHGDWEEVCSGYTTFGAGGGCYSDRRIGHLSKAYDALSWMGWVMQAAGVWASYVGNAPAGAIVGGGGLVFSGGALIVGQHLRYAEQHRC